ncbi:MAG: deoxyribonuclease IV [Bacilli bacterium]|nr:deoxyribonuclease IV [Mollicutes bacterium]MDY3898724.1 deoxyribonuclease IV [Bacilli bacterium]
MKIGSHVSNNGIKMLEGSVEEALSYGANALMVYLGAPQNTFRKPFNQMHINEALELCKKNNIDPEDIIVHAPYIVNLAQSDNQKWDYAITFLGNELMGTAMIGAKYMVLHPGAHVGMGSNYGIERIANGINCILSDTINYRSVILLETMAGKGTECGRTFEEIKAIIDRVHNKNRIGVCLDTCHINDAGYDIVNDYEGVIDEFDRIIGLEYLKVIHLNDSKNPVGSHKDRHENIGFGTIGFDTLMKFVNDERFKDIPKILETPYIPYTKDLSFPPYQEEIAMIKSGKFNENLKNEILSKINIK